MTATEYWQGELARTLDLARGYDLEVVAALLIARQLQNLNGTLSEIKARLAIIEEHLQ